MYWMYWYIFALHFSGGNRKRLVTLWSYIPNYEHGYGLALEESGDPSIPVIVFFAKRQHALILANR